MRIAISGAGVAGPAFAYWMHRAGNEVTLVEQAPSFRTGGYLIDFWGLGYDVAEKMGIEADLRKVGYRSRHFARSTPMGAPAPACASMPSGGPPNPIYQHCPR